MAELIPVHIQQLFVALKLEKHEAAAKFTEKINLQRSVASYLREVLVLLLMFQQDNGVFDEESRSE